MELAPVNIIISHDLVACDFLIKYSSLLSDHIALLTLNSNNMVRVVSLRKFISTFANKLLIRIVD